jgi:hypothetical protein
LLLNCDLAKTQIGEHDYLSCSFYRNFIHLFSYQTGQVLTSQALIELPSGELAAPQTILTQQ